VVVSFAKQWELGRETKIKMGISRT
jgi:hypothetical protein